MTKVVKIVHTSAKIADCALITSVAIAMTVVAVAEKKQTISVKDAKTCVQNVLLKKCVRIAERCVRTVLMLSVKHVVSAVAV